MTLRICFLVVASCFVAAGCGDDDRPAADAGPASDAGLPGDAGVLRPEDIPAVPLGGDPADACPEPFVTDAPAEGLNRRFQSAGQSREFVLLLPDSAAFPGPRPVFVAFNGTGESGPRFVERANLEEFVARGFLVLAPSSNQNGTIWPVWDDMRNADDADRPNPDIIFFDDLLACTAAHYEVDRNRVYVGGHSAGGIFTNAILQRRSELLAGGIVASGIFDLTSPPGLDTLDPMFVLVTWGGDDDGYSDPDVPAINFVEQASRSSQFYDAHPTVAEVNCHADPGRGHAWLDMNDWFVDRLLEHPKGLPGADGELVFPSAPAGYTCADEPAEFVSSITVECPPSDTAGCQTFCQYLGDCAVENATVGPAVAPQLEAFGFAGEDLTMCEGCVEWCGAQATTGPDAEVLTCIEAASSAMCGPGIEGFLPFADAINSCCMGRTDSPLCVETCRIFLTHSIAPSIVTVCPTIVP